MIQKIVSEPSPQPVGANFQPRYVTFKLPPTFVAPLPQPARSEATPEAIVVALSVGAGAQISASLSRTRSPKSHRYMNQTAPAYGIDLNGDGYLRLKEVLSVYPVSRAGWYAGLAAGLYPPSVPLGKRAVGWTRESIRQLIANPPKF